MAFEKRMAILRGIYIDDSQMDHDGQFMYTSTLLRICISVPLQHYRQQGGLVESRVQIQLLCLSILFKIYFSGDQPSTQKSNTLSSLLKKEHKCSCCGSCSIVDGCQCIPCSRRHACRLVCVCLPCTLGFRFDLYAHIAYVKVKVFMLTSPKCSVTCG